MQLSKMKPGKVIPASRDRMQSELLTGALSILLLGKAAAVTWQLHRLGALPGWWTWSLICSAAFAALVWRLRSATGAAALTGGLVCFNVLLGQSFVEQWWQTAMPALIMLFALTFAATRYGRSRKERLGVAEQRSGRRAAQVLANLGVAGLCAGASSSALLLACLAALAEATADTVSSEMGQALPGRTLLLTTWQEVPPGTDGGISIAGTTLGVASAGAIVLVSAGVGNLSFTAGLIVFFAAVAGLLFDSVLGATVERRGWLGNNLVNFSSTVFAAGLAWTAAHWF